MPKGIEEGLLCRERLPLRCRSAGQVLAPPTDHPSCAWPDQLVRISMRAAAGWTAANTREHVCAAAAGTSGSGFQNHSMHNWKGCYGWGSAASGFLLGIATLKWMPSASEPSFWHCTSCQGSEIVPRADGGNLPQNFHTSSQLRLAHNYFHSK